MTYIINPMWFYWLSVVDGAYQLVNASATLLAILAGVLFVTAAAFKYAARESNGYDEKCYEYITGVKIQKSARTVTVVAMILFIIRTFIPLSETLLEMQIARFATVENAEWALDAVKSATDYIVSAIKELQ